MGSDIIRGICVEIMISLALYLFGVLVLVLAGKVLS